MLVSPLFSQRSDFVLTSLFSPRRSLQRREHRTTVRAARWMAAYRWRRYRSEKKMINPDRKAASNHVPLPPCVKRRSDPPRRASPSPPAVRLLSHCAAVCPGRRYAYPLLSCLSPSSWIRVLLCLLTSRYSGITSW